MPAEALYVYGVTRSGARAHESGATGVAGAPLRDVDAGPVSALVSDLPGGTRALGREEMTAHARVLEDVVTRETVLPMRFGIVMEGEDAVRHDLLEAHREELQRQLEELAGKVELRLRVIYEEDRLMREVVEQEPEVARLRESLRGLPEDASHFARIELGELVAQAIERRREHDVGWILETLAPLALDLTVAEPSHERMVLSGSFLVQAREIERFDEAVDRLGRAQAGRMAFRYTGPLPPHSFVELQARA